MAPDETARVEHGITPYLPVIADDGSQFPQTSIDGHPTLVNLINVNGILRQLEVGNFDPCTQMGVKSKNRITHIVEMRSNSVVEQETVFDLGGISNHTVITNNNVLSDVSIASDLAMFTDDSRPFDDRARLHHRAFTN